MSIRAKLWAGFGIVLALAALVGVVGISGIRTVGDSADQIDLRGVQPLAHVGNARTALADLRGDTRDHIIASTAADRQQARQKLDRNDKIVTDQLEELREHIGGDDQAELDTAIAQFDKYVDARRATIDASNADDDARAYALLASQALPSYQQAVGALSALAETIEQKANAEVARTGDTERSRSVLAIALLAAAILAGAAVATVLARRIAHDARVVLEAADGIAAGDLDQDVHVRSRDEIGAMAAAFRRMVAYLNEMAEDARRIAAGDLAVDVRPQSERDVLGNAMRDMQQSLTTMVGEVSRTAETLSASSQEMASSSGEAGRAVDEIARAVQDIAHGAEQQVQSIDVVQAAAQEMEASTRAASDVLAETAAAAAQAREVTRRGAGAVSHATEVMGAVRATSEEVTEAMADLAAKSEQIGTIVVTITGIAEQTNLLALNAAIEAARAGEQGRGFAVVAEEVRKLAEESQQAAESIATLIGDIQSETGRAVEIVEDGARRSVQGAGTVEAAHEAFDAIGRSVDDMTNLIDQVAAAAAQVADAASRVQQDIAGIASVAEESSASTEQVSASTQETSASAQEISSSAEHLAGQAEQLTTLVGRFRLEG
jgi:methyl-accepting chemotaxis protein